MDREKLHKQFINWACTFLLVMGAGSISACNGEDDSADLADSPLTVYQGGRIKEVNFGNVVVTRDSDKDNVVYVDYHHLFNNRFTTREGLFGNIVQEIEQACLGKETIVDPGGATPLKTGVTVILDLGTNGDCIGKLAK